MHTSKQIEQNDFISSKFIMLEQEYRGLLLENLLVWVLGGDAEDVPVSLVVLCLWRLVKATGIPLPGYLPQSKLRLRPQKSLLGLSPAPFQAYWELLKLSCWICTEESWEQFLRRLWEIQIHALWNLHKQKQFPLQFSVVNNFSALII